MLNKILIVVGCLAALALAVPVQAVINNTSHDLAVGTSSGCAACHIPHGAQGTRLWPATPGTNTEYVGAVAPLCGYCHNTGGVGGAGAISATHVYGANSHGRQMTKADPPWGTAIVSSGLPYTAATDNGLYIECTSCHNVHDDTQRPFLRDSLDAICARCHTNRHYVNNTLSQGGTVTPGTWGAAQAGAGNPGSHPVGTDVTGDVFGTVGNSPISIAQDMRVVRSTTVDGWVLGGHTMAAGGVTCVTCHAAHGIQDDATTTTGTKPTASFIPAVNFLAVEQASTTFTVGSTSRSVANGSGDYNALCEACHGGQMVGTTTDGSALNHNINPGDVDTFTHPVDDFGAANTGVGVAAFPTSWPTTTITATNVDPVPICESCHATHPTADAARADLNNAGGAAYILRDDMTAFCTRCHASTTQFTGHHPIGKTYNSSGVSYLTGHVTGAASDVLSCYTCHQGAHNWVEAGMPAVTSGWIPAGNGKSATKATDQFNADMSKTCMDCHYTMVGGDTARTTDPTFGASHGLTGLEAAYQTDGTASHYVGLVHAGGPWQSTTAPAGTGANMEGNWVSTNYAGASNGWSRFGGTSGTKVLVCESCHELEPDKNYDTRLLLSQYTEGLNGAETGSVIAGRDDFCEACHGVPTGTHAVTGQVVGRTGATLSTGAAAWLRGTVLGYATLGSNALSCDGCHQPHNANTNSGTFILDAPESVTINATSYLSVAAGTAEGTEPSVSSSNPTYLETTTSGGYTSTTWQGRGGQYTAYCDQCHTYAY